MFPLIVSSKVVPLAVVACMVAEFGLGVGVGVAVIVGFEVRVGLGVGVELV